MLSFCRFRSFRCVTSLLRFVFPFAIPSCRRPVSSFPCFDSSLLSSMFRFDVSFHLFVSPFWPRWTGNKNSCNSLVCCMKRLSLPYPFCWMLAYALNNGPFHFLYEPLLMRANFDFKRYPQRKKYESADTFLPPKRSKVPTELSPQNFLWSSPLPRISLAFNGGGGGTGLKWNGPIWNLKLINTQKGHTKLNCVSLRKKMRVKISQPASHRPILRPSDSYQLCYSTWSWNLLRRRLIVFIDTQNSWEICTEDTFLVSPLEHLWLEALGIL